MKKDGLPFHQIKKNNKNKWIAILMINKVGLLQQIIHKKWLKLILLILKLKNNKILKNCLKVM
jgi:hypothetical protein